MSARNAIYKICTIDEWELAQTIGEYRGSDDDMRDGFIHFSTQSQLHGTLEKHFKGRKNLIILKIDTKRLDQSLLKWETSRNNEKFPHLYGYLNIDAVIDHEVLLES
ncbi:MAG: DUF952 domain-containing protein, partial [Proteobacteria bacterium]|nr:DUF952 domain-containing protein [Pseudomonadota bacterium]